MILKILTYNINHTLMNTNKSAVDKIIKYIKADCSDLIGIQEGGLMF